MTLSIKRKITVKHQCLKKYHPLDDSEFLRSKTEIVNLKMNAKVRIFVKSFVGRL